MPILSLCTGYGGLDMAVQALTGDKVAYVAENDEAASLLLEYHWPEVPNLGDITTYDFTQLAGRVDKVTAGFSCQDISNAGPRGGINGSRSRVWKDVCRAIRDVRPRYAFLENVGAIRSRGLYVVAEDLASVGYDLRWTTLRASALPVGAAHIRERWFGIATPHATVPGLEVRNAEAGDRWSAPVRSGSVPEDPHGAAESQRLGPAPRKAAGGGHGPTLDDEVSFLLPHAKSLGRPERRPEPAQRQGQVRRPAGDGCEPAADPDGIGRDGGAGDEPEEVGRDEPANSRYSPAGWWGQYLPAIRRWEDRIGVPAPAPTELGPRGGRRLTASFAEWLMGVPGHVTSVPGLSRSDQLHKIGNGAMPQQAYVAYEYLLNLIEMRVS